ncbi:glycosyltransferase [Rhodobacteraceae bacterium NNCM2]|nr:glycosyltransferase [Coraliihabitans acroporae]
MSGIAVIIVNYNAAELAMAAVESVLARQHGGRAVEVHLVDNASPAGDAAVLAREAEARGWDGRVRLWLEQTNHGFGRGNNLVLDHLAARETPPDYVFLLNPDAALENETLAVLADFLDAHPKAAVAGARIEKPGGIPVTAAFRFPSLASEFSGSLGFGPVARLLSRWRVSLGADIPTGRVDWVAGAAMMARLDALKSMDFFDPAYFLYYEEVDLMHRLARAGWETWYVAEAEAIHVEGVSTAVKSDRAERRRRRPAYWYHSWRIYYRSTHGRAYALLAGVCRMSGAALNHVLARLRGQEPVAPSGFFGDFWAVGLRPLLGLEARPHD